MSLHIPPEYMPTKSPTTPIEILQIRSQIIYHLWTHWNRILLLKQINYYNLGALLNVEYTEKIKNWIDGNYTWNELILTLIQDLESSLIKHYFVFTLHPSAQFGLPDNNRTVVPSNREEAVSSPELLTKDMIIIDHGTLSEYRPDKKKITINHQIMDSSIKIKDNFVFIEKRSNNSHSLMDETITFMEHFVNTMTLYLKSKYDFKLISATDQYGRKIPHMAMKEFLQVTWYDLDQTKEKIKQSLNTVELIYEDKTLLKSLEYYNHAKYLEEINNDLSFYEREKRRFLIADVIMNLYKSVTIIIGDPSTDSKVYQSKYKKYGITYKYWNTQIKQLVKIRNSNDIAHYDISNEKLNELIIILPTIYEIAIFVINHYLEYLTDKRTKKVSEQ